MIIINLTEEAIIDILEYKRTKSITKATDLANKLVKIVEQNVVNVE